MKKALTGLAIAAAALVGVTLATTQPAQASSTKFTANEVNNPTGYFNSTKAQYAFHFKTEKAKVGKKTVKAAYLYLGDFKKPSLLKGYVTKYTLSKNRRTLTTTYRIFDTEGNLSNASYKFTLYKQSSTKFKGYLTYRGVNVHYLSNKGTAYTFTKTKSSPATKFAQYAKPALETYYTDQLNASVQKQYQEGIAAGKNYKDPATDSEVQDQIKSKVADYVSNDLTSLAKSFNG